MDWIVVVYLIYAVVLLAGGAIGFVKAQSLPSLVAGVVSGALAAIAAVLLNLQASHFGLGLGLVLSAAMEAFFLLRFRWTKQAMPALPMVVISSGVFAASIAALVLPQGHHG